MTFYTLVTTGAVQKYDKSKSIERKKKCSGNVHVSVQPTLIPELITLSN